MRVIHISTEFAPIAKAGGMGEVVLGLSRELIAQGHSVEVILPKYSFLDPTTLDHLEKDREVQCEEKGQPISNTIWKATVAGCPLSLIEAHHPANYFERKQIYGYEDDVPRFLYFCKTVIEYLISRKEPIELIQVHDWHSASCALLLRDLYPNQLKVGAILLTIHNVEYQGRCAVWDLNAIGLNGASYLTPDRLQDPTYPEAINLLKGGILYATGVNTVSRTYAKECVSPEGGCGLGPLLKKAKLVGIVNGIDTQSWDPETDPHLHAHYRADQPSELIAKQKSMAKEELKQILGLQSLDRPLFGAVTRIMPNKGSDLFLAAIGQIMEEGGAFVLLGFSPISDVQKKFDEAKEQYRGNPAVALCYEYNDALDRNIYAACDFILVPSLMEPCGLTQIIAMRYGAIPIVRATGGLKDTVIDYERPKGNGIVFEDPTFEALHEAIKRASMLWQTPPLFQEIQKRGLQGDYSWKKPAEQYLQLYELLSKAFLI